MYENQKQLESALSALTFDDHVDIDHRDRLEAKLMQQYNAQNDRPVSNNYPLWRSIVNNKVARISSIAALLVIAFGLFAVFSTPKGGDVVQDALTLVTRSCQAEEVLFTGDKVRYLLNEITVYPIPEEARMPKTTDGLIAEEAFQKAEMWLNYNWLPVYTIKGDGSFRFNELSLAEAAEQEYVIQDQAWYDPATGRFVRTMTLDDSLLMANAWDGNTLYESLSGEMGLTIDQEKTTGAFKAPMNPENFLGLAAGLKHDIAKQEDCYRVADVFEDTLDSGQAVTVYQLGLYDNKDELKTYWLIKVNLDNEQIVEMEFVQNDYRRIVMRRVKSEQVSPGQVDWSLEGERSSIASDIDPDQLRPVVKADMVVPDMTVAQMEDESKYSTFTIEDGLDGYTPPYIVGMVDVPSPDYRQYVQIYTSRNDDRHVIIFFAETHNNLLRQTLEPIADSVFPPIYTTKRGYRVFSGGPNEKDWTKVTFSLCGIDPVEDRTGFEILTDDHTVVFVIVNGTFDDATLHTIFDKVAPSKEILAQ